MSDESEPHRTIVLGISAPGLVEFNPSRSKSPVIEIDTRSLFGAGAAFCQTLFPRFSSIPKHTRKKIPNQYKTYNL
jgi:hypothetical protein